MRVDVFDFDLPEEKIALRPLADRNETKLLHVNSSGFLKDYKVKDLPDLLKKGDILVFNNTKVIPARLEGVRKRADYKTTINVTLHKPETEDSWRAFVRPLKRLKLGEEIIFHPMKQRTEETLCAKEIEEIAVLTARLVEKYEDGEVCLTFNASGEKLKRLLFYYGAMPLPPYIAAKRGEDIQDDKDYQTIFAQYEGAVAAPTAGLHFTKALLTKLQENHIDSAFVTLHVGAGTFFPVKADDTIMHKMHSEYAVLDGETACFLNQAKKEGRRIIAVGTTALRVLESAAIASGEVAPYAQETDIFITPGYEFLFADGLITNFHLPRSTLFMLVSAFCSLDIMKNAYQHAVDNNYRFYSYGDTSFLEYAALK